MRILAVYLAATACGSSTPTPSAPAEVATVADAAPAPPDASVPADVASAPAWIFRYNAPGRLETWTLRYHGDRAAVDVESKTGVIHYVGAASDAASLTLTLAAGSARLSLDCKHEQLAVGATCGDKKAPKLDVLACYHPDFAAPMPFGLAPGVEYVTSDACTGYVRATSADAGN
jgi:hypothetical protein